MKNSTKIILWLIFFFPYGLYLLIRQLLFKVQQQFDAQEDERKRLQESLENKLKANEKEREEYRLVMLAEQEKKKKEQKKYAEERAKQKMALAKAKREEHNKKLLAFKKKYSDDATKALAGKIWLNMPFELYSEAQAIRPNGRKFGKMVYQKIRFG